MEQSKLDSMYANYKMEYEDVNTVFIEDIGFANWKKENKGIYVQEVYVMPLKRGRKYAAELTDMCIKDAESKDIEVEVVYTTVTSDANTVNSSIRAITEYGFKLLKSDTQLIYFYKELKHG